MIKKVLFLTIIIAVLAFFTLPNLIFADEGDATTYVGVRDQETHGGVYTGQYVLGDDEDTIGDGENDGDTDVYCIDGDTYVDQGNGKYEYTGDTASEDLGNEIDPVDALAVEIIAQNETGASPTEDQVAVWELTGDANPNVKNSLNVDQEGIVNQIVFEATDYAEKALDDDPSNDSVLDKINDIEVVLDDKPLYDETTGNANEHTAEAIMAEPFVPGVTDGVNESSADFTGDVGSVEETIGADPEDITATGAKTVFWYILEGSYNVSFSETELVTETTSGMFNYADACDDEPGIDNDGDVAISEDQYGMAKVNYYYYWWGGDYPEHEEMNANIGAWVDIDEDEKFDIIDTEASSEDDIEDVKKEFSIVQTTVNDNGTDSDTSDDFNEVTIDDNGTPGDYTDDTVATEQLPDETFDVKIVEGGLVIKSKDDAGKDGPGNELPDITDQRFITDSASEPYGSSVKKYEAWAEIEIQKTDATDKSPLEGSTFQLYRVLTEFDAELIDEIVLEPGSNGNHSWTGLYWGTYFVRETVAPPGYALAPDAYATVGYHMGSLNGIGLIIDELISVDEIKITEITRYPGSLYAYIEEEIADPRLPGSITVYKYSGSTPLAGAVFDVVSADGTFSAKITSGADGYASISGLEWGIYYIKEVIAPDGYDIDPNTYTLVLGATALSAAKDVEDDPIPPPTPPVTPPTTEVAGISEIEVLGISEELPFTGLNPIVPITGGSLLLAGLTLMVISMVRNKRQWKHAIGYKDQK